MNKYLVALSIGGLMEMPEITHEKFDVIDAENQSEAVKKYNTKYNCRFYHGVCMAEKVGGKINILNEKASLKDVECLGSL